MTHLADHCVAGPFVRRASSVGRQSRSASRRMRCGDARWPAVTAALSALRAEKRRSVRIVDADCGAGSLLLCAAAYARSLGFTAIEARGIGATRALAGRGQAAADVVRDPAIAITFETADMVDALAEETDFPADIILWHGCKACAAIDAGAVANAVACAGHMVIADPADRTSAA